MGIDPGLATTGYGIIQESGSGYRLIAAGAIITKPTLTFGKRLQRIYSDIGRLITRHHPSIIGIEQLFFARNVSTALTVGQARGVICLACAHHACTIREFTPLQIKQALTGYGHADKVQMQKMVTLILKLKTAPQPDDVADALAIALCTAQTKHFVNQKTR